MSKELTYTNPNNDVANLKYGTDYFVDLTNRSELYAGGRLPQFFSPTAPNTDSSYDSNNYMTCTRTLSTNLGAYTDNVENRSFNNLIQYDANHSHCEYKHPMIL